MSTPLAWEWSWDAPVPPERLWPLVSDTSRVNRAVGLAPWHFREVPDPAGGSRRLGTSRVLGFPLEWDEHPHEWERPVRFAVERVYKEGPVSRIVNTVRLEATAGGTRLSHRIDVDPRSLLGRVAAWWQVGVLSKRAFDRVYRSIIDVVASGGAGFPQAEVTLPPAARARAAELASRLSRSFPPALVERLVSEKVLGAPDREVARLRPFALAREWNADRMEVLRLCLSATRAGLLTMSWDLLCPGCRGAKGRSGSLEGVASTVHCSSCNIDFGADFSRSLEVSFAPAPAVRQVEVVEYCAGGPWATPHVMVQKRLAPGERASLKPALPPGGYRLRGPRTASVLDLVVEEGGSGTATFTTGSPPTSARVAPGFTLELVNADSDEQLVLGEKAAWVADAATADVVTSLQQFRDLFSREALASDVQLSVTSLAFLFTDLKGSTELYERVGDAPAFAAVREHFDVLTAIVAARNGGVVKTIGDAVMAVFPEPADALRAGADILRRFAPFQARSGPTLAVKLGLHAGPCIAVTLNERLDYFGTTVNTAARAQGESVGGDLVVTRKVLDDPGVATALQALAPATQEPFTASLKGLAEDVALVRLRF